jgi:hypothetical protein
MQAINHIDQALNQEPVKQELTLFITGDLNSFVKATNQIVIKKDTQEHLVEVIRLIMVKVGLRAANLPSEIETAVLLSHIATEYGNHTCEEIKLAFDLAIAAKLDLKEVSCYENFSCLYFSTIMNAYRLWAKEQAAQIKPEPVKEEKKEFTVADKKEWIAELKAKENLALAEIPDLFYGWMNLTNEKDYHERSMNYCRHQIAEANTSFAYKKTQLVEFKRQEDEGFEGAFKVLIVNTAKKMAVFHEFKKPVIE